MITYELLAADEWYKLQNAYKDSFPLVPIPGPDISSVAVAKDNDGNIIGFWFLQLALLMEPAWVSPLHPEVSLNKLREVLHNKLSASPKLEYYVHTATDEWDSALKSVGFIPIGLAYIGQVPEVGENNYGSSGTSSS